MQKQHKRGPAPKRNSRKTIPPVKRGQSTPPLKKAEKPLYIVGVGASAGGLEALRLLFAALRPTDSLSFVVVQHLAPQHRSRLVELIAQTTLLKVREVADGEAVLPNTIYITPPNADVELSKTTLRLVPPEAKVGPKPSIDRFFRSMADEAGENAIGVILSGTGSDGAQGIRAIKAAGGVTIAQTLESSKYDGMPRAARQTGAVDLELAPAEIARQLMLFNAYAARAEEGEPPRGSLPTQDPYQTVISILQKACKVDFSGYKQSTVRRRIDRRMFATRCGSLQEYADYLRSRSDEPQFLFQDILISVTSFFRDAQSFAALREFVAKRIADIPEGGTVRAWVVGCATGEEAYTVAILLHEAIAAQHKHLRIQLFATDIDERAMGIARKGAYPKTVLEEVPPDLRSKYFTQSNDMVQVKGFLRDSVVFARHDMTLDPPFLKLDLISCRNVLIYCTAPLQEQILKTFHFALEEKGLLFLGKSESVSASGGLYHVADKNAKIFYRSAKKSHLPRGYTRSDSKRETLLQSQDRATTSSMSAIHTMITAFAPDSAVVDGDLRVEYLFGKANRYLNLPQGELSMQITKLLPAPFGRELPALINRAEKSGHSVRGAMPHTFSIDGVTHPVQLAVIPLNGANGREYVIAFPPMVAELPELAAVKPGALSGLSKAEQIRRLRKELSAAQSHLQAIMQEHETANEELQALNEELQSANEELQSSNEELETTNEELQSANEELTTLNQEVNVRSTELLLLSQRLQAIQNAISYPLLVVDTKLRLIDLNPAARFVLRVSEADRGHSLRALTVPLEFGGVVDMVEECLQQGHDGRNQLRNQDREFEIRVQLFRGSHDQIEGAVVSFVDNTDLVRAIDENRAANERLSSILENTPAIVTMKDMGGAYQYANKRFCDTFGVSLGSVLGKTDEELFGETVGSAMRDRDFEVLKTRTPMRYEESIPAGGNARYWLSSKFPLMDERRKARSICTVALDVTDAALHRRQLEAFKLVVSSTNAGIMIFDRAGAANTPSLVTYEFAKRLGTTEEHLRGLDLQGVLKLLGKHGEAEEHAEVTARVLAKGTSSFVFNIAAKPEQEDWIELKAANLEFENPRATYLVLKIFDINDRIRTQRVLQAQQDEVARFSKLASLGEVAAGISHEINTPLNVISTKADLLRRLSQREKLDQAKTAAVAGEIEHMVQSISSVIAGLKSLSRRESARMSIHDLRELVHEAIRICDFAIRRMGVRLELKLPSEAVPIHCYPVQLVQIVVNLVNNAADAVAELPERWVRIEAHTGGNKAKLCVIDSGPGIDPALAEKIMAPFFTTKGESSGTGLGLSISRNIARQHDGELIVDATKPNTTFVLELPLADPASVPS